jgi:hypothetical protein
MLSRQRRSSQRAFEMRLHKRCHATDNDQTSALGADDIDEVVMFSALASLKISFARSSSSPSRVCTEIRI